MCMLFRSNTTLISTNVLDQPDNHLEYVAIFVHLCDIDSIMVLLLLFGELWSQRTLNHWWFVLENWCCPFICWCPPLCSLVRLQSLVHTRTHRVFSELSFNEKDLRSYEYIHRYVWLYSVFPMVLHWSLQRCRYCFYVRPIGKPFSE